MTWRPLWEARPDEHECLRRVIMAGYYREAGVKTPNVGEAYYGDPDERGSRWIWKGGSDVIEPLGFQDLPDFPVEEAEDGYCSGKRKPE